MVFGHEMVIKKKELLRIVITPFFDSGNALKAICINRLRRKSDKILEANRKV